MRRQGCALFFGLLVSGAALAQPPAVSERYPPAPELPGVVVGHSPSERTVVSVAPLAVKRTGLNVTEPAPMPDKTSPEKHPPATQAASTPTEPAIESGKDLATPCPPKAGKCAKRCCTGGILDWLTYHSKARQSGCNIPPYMPPLQSWFPCDPRGRSCTSCAAKSCCTVPASDPTVIGPSGPVVIPPTIPPSCNNR